MFLTQVKCLDMSITTSHGPSELCFFLLQTDSWFSTLSFNSVLTLLGFDFSFYLPPELLTPLFQNLFSSLWCLVEWLAASVQAVTNTSAMDEFGCTECKSPVCQMPHSAFSVFQSLVISYLWSWCAVINFIHYSF